MSDATTADPEPEGPTTEGSTTEAPTTAAPKPAGLGDVASLPNTGGVSSGLGSLQPVTVRRGLADDAAQGNFWRQIGGRPTFEALVRRFYDGVQTDPLIWPMYPHDDLEGAIQRLTGFLEQYWGGPTAYSDERGHPRLRMRHMPFAITPTARDRWLVHMRAAVDSLGLSPLDDATLWGYLERAAHAMVNTAGD